MNLYKKKLIIKQNTFKQNITLHLENKYTTNKKKTDTLEGTAENVVNYC